MNGAVNFRKVTIMTQGSSCINNKSAMKHEKETIHSGHFMVSNFESEAQDDDFNVAVPVPDEESNVVSISVSNRPNSQTYCVNVLDKTTQQVSIETSLSKLFHCMSLAYRQKLTSPKWNRFKGIRLRWKDKIRLNNVIWRCWHMQFIKKQNTLVCQFASPLDVDTHNKPEAVVLEGKYWKRKLAAVTAEYKRWRMFYRNKIMGWSSKDCSDMLTEADMFDVQPHSNDSAHSTGSMMVDEDYMDFMSDTLFSTITYNQPFAFPDTREITRTTNIADFMQPSLVQLQPNLEDFMDTLEPLQEFLSAKLPSVPEEPAAVEIDYRSSKSVGCSYSDLDILGLQVEQNVDHHLQQQQQQQLQQQQIQQHLQQELFRQQQLQLQLKQQEQQIQRQQQQQLQQKLQQQQHNSVQNYSPNFNTSYQSANEFQAVTSSESPRSGKGRSSRMSHSSRIQQQQQQQNVMYQQPQQQTVNQMAYDRFPVSEMQSFTSQSSQSQCGTVAHQTAPPPPPPLPPPPSSGTTNFKYSSQPGNYRFTQSPAQGFKTYSQSCASPPVAAMASTTLSSPSLSPQQQVQNVSPPIRTPQRSNSLPGAEEKFVVPSKYNHVTKPKRSQSGSSLGVSQSQQPLVSTGSDMSSLNSSALLAQLLTTNSGLFKFTAGSENLNTVATSGLKTSSMMPILPAVSSSVPQSTTTLLITTPVTMTQVQAAAHPSNQIILNSAGCSTRRPDSPCDNSAISSSANVNISPLPSPTHPSDTLGSSKNIRIRHDSDRVPYKIHKTDHRRVCHINAEQKRRCNIKNGFDMLHSLIPQLHQNPNTKLSKAAMLQKGADYICQLRTERSQLRDEMDSLRQQIECLNTAISNCQSMLPATGAPVSRQRASKMREMFDEYVRIRTLENWKFWIFSILIEPLLASFNSSVSTASLEDLYRSTLLWVEQHCSLVDLRPAVLNSLRYLCTATDILTDPSRLPEEARQAVTKQKHSLPH